MVFPIELHYQANEPRNQKDDMGGGIAEQMPSAVIDL